MADGRHLKSYFGYIAKIRFSMAIRWYVEAQSCSGTGQMTKLTMFQNSRWRTAAILKIVSSLYLSRGSSNTNEIWCAAADFGFKDGHLTKYQNIVNSTWPTAAILKIVFWPYLRDLLSD